MTRTRLRRWAETLVVLGLCLMAASAVAGAQDATPTPEPTATPEATATATVTATPTPSPEATLAPTLTPEPAATASPSPSPTPTATEAPPVLTSQAPQRQATATPTPAPITGAALTICHFDGTGYVPVTIAADQSNPHYDHPLDIIPAPASGCSGITPQNIDELRNEPVSVCHLQDDGSYVLQRYPNGDLGGHEAHAGDLIPAPGGTCPGLDPDYVTPTVTATAEPSATATATGGEPEDEGDVFGDETEATPTPAPAAAAAPQAGTTPGAQQLPFTGFDLWLIASAGLGLTLMGAGLRLLAQPPAVGVTR